MTNNFNNLYNDTIKNSGLIGINNIYMYEYLKKYNINTVNNFMIAYNKGLYKNESSIVTINVEALVRLFKFKYLGIIDEDLVRLLNTKLKVNSWSHQSYNARYNYIVCAYLGMSLSEAMFFSRVSKQYSGCTIIECLEEILKTDIINPIYKNDSFKNLVTLLVLYYHAYENNKDKIYSSGLFRR